MWKFRVDSWDRVNKIIAKLSIKSIIDDFTGFKKCYVKYIYIYIYIVRGGDLNIEYLR